MLSFVTLKSLTMFFSILDLTWSSFLTTCLSRKGDKYQLLLLKGHNNWMSQPWILNTNARDQRVIRGGIVRSCKVVLFRTTFTF